MMAADLPSLIAALASLPEHRRQAVRIPIATARAILARKGSVPPVARPADIGITPAPQPSVSPSPASGAENTRTAPALSSPFGFEDAAPSSNAPPPHTPPVPGPDRAGRLAALRERVLPCAICPHLAASRKNVVFGAGNPEAELMFVGEAPGADEDAQGEPFVGAAGKLLTKIIEAMALSRDRVYIANVLKCRPDMPPGSTGNRPPRKEEMAACLPHLLEQIRIIAPRCIVALGSTAVCGLFGLPEVRMGAVRGKWKVLELGGPQGGAVPVMVTYHPAYLLRNQSLSEKRKVWDDMLAVLEHLGHPITARQRSYFLPPGR